MKQELNDDQISMLRHIITTTFYYIDYPVNVPLEWRKNGEGKSILINSMGLDHLKASVKMIERDLKYLAYDKEINKVIIPRANEKLSELRKAFNNKAAI